MISSSHFGSKQPTLNLLNTRLPVKNAANQAASYPSLQSNSHSGDTFFSGNGKRKELSREQKNRHNITEANYRARKKETREEWEAACKKAGIDIRTLWPPEIKLPPAKPNMTEREKKDRHNIVEANYRARKKEYLINLKEAAENIDAEGESDQEAIPHEPIQTNTDYQFGAPGWDSWKNQSYDEPSHPYGGYIPNNFT